MTSFPVLQSRSANLACPQCGTCCMWVTLRCDTDRECMTFASCDNCGRQYDAEILPTYAERYRPGLPLLARQIFQDFGGGFPDGTLPIRQGSLQDIDGGLPTDFAQRIHGLLA
jgi:predicted RNA-binding Zn-ribbon protein involved in translation (DUF1610 family)